MSRGAGYVERGVEECLRSQTDRAWALSDLCLHVYNLPSKALIQTKHRNTVARALRNVLKRQPRWDTCRTSGTGETLAFNLDSLRSVKAAALAIASVKELLEKAISSGDDIAVMECLVLAIERHDPQQHPLIEAVFVPAIVSLTGRAEARWIHGAWFLEAGKTFFPALPADKADLVLDNLLALPKIEHHAERILVYIAQSHPEAVWRFFERRLVRMREDKQERYEAFPYRFFGLEEKPLGANPDLAVESVRKSFNAEDPLFRFDGGRLLSTVFPACPESFANKRSGLAENGSDEDVTFVLGVLQNYKGEVATHPVLRALVNRLPDGDPRFAQVEISLQNTGGVWGEFGFVEAFQQKKAEMASWLEDQRPRVREFATEFIRRLDQRIASEQRSAEQDSELRKRSFDTEEESDS